MKCHIPVLTALAGCAFARATFETVESRDFTPDLDLVSRDGLSLEVPEANAFIGRDDVDVVIKARSDVDLIGRTDTDLEIRQPVPDECPKRRDARPFRRLPKYPFPTSTIIGWIFIVRLRLFNTKPLYFLLKRSTNDYFYTTSASERENAIYNLGYANHGVKGFVFRDTTCGGSPLYRMYNSRRQTHFYTVSLLERNVARRWGWVDEGVIGYIFRV